MRILYIANAKIPTEKAHGVQIMKMCEAFALLGHEVELAFAKRKGALPDDPFLYYAVKKSFTLRPLWCLDTVRFGATGFYLQWISFALSAALYARLHPADIVYSRDPLALFLLSYLSRRRLVFEIHTKRAYGFLGRVFRRARIVAISRGLIEHYAKRYRIPTEAFIYAPDGVDAEAFAAPAAERDAARSEVGAGEGSFVVGYVGKLTTMGEEKGLSDLIEAAGEASKRLPLFLLLVGASPEEKFRAEALSASAGLSGKCAVLPHVPPREVPRYLAASDVLVMNYPATEHYARFMSPLKLFEYMASGTPLIATDLPTVREIVDETCAHLVPPSDPRALAETLAYLHEHPSEARERAQAARHRAERYDWKHRAERILNELA